MAYFYSADDFNKAVDEREKEAQAKRDYYAQQRAERAAKAANTRKKNKRKAERSQKSEGFSLFNWLFK